MAEKFGHQTDDMDLSKRRESVDGVSADKSSNAAGFALKFGLFEPGPDIIAIGQVVYEQILPHEGESKARLVIDDHNQNTDYSFLGRA